MNDHGVSRFLRRSQRLRFIHGMLSGAITGIICFLAVRGTVDRIKDISKPVGMTLAWTSGAFPGIGVLVGLFLSMLFSMFVNEQEYVSAVKITKEVQEELKAETAEEKIDK